MYENPIILSWPDHAELTAMVEAQRARRSGPDVRAFERLAGELARAQLVAAQDMPPDVVTMNTKARVRDLDSNEVFAFTLAWPAQADAASGRVNVLAPLGMALLGSRVGQQVEWAVPDGIRRLHVEAVLFQPEKDLPSAAS